MEICELLFREGTFCFKRENPVRFFVSWNILASYSMGLDGSSEKQGTYPQHQQGDLTSTEPEWAWPTCIGSGLGPSQSPSNSPSSKLLYRPLLCRLPHALWKVAICYMQQLLTFTAKNKGLKIVPSPSLNHSHGRWRKRCYLTYRSSGRATTSLEGAREKDVYIFSSVRLHKYDRTDIFGSSCRKCVPPTPSSFPFLSLPTGLRWVIAGYL